MWQEVELRKMNYRAIGVGREQKACENSKRSKVDADGSRRKITQAQQALTGESASIDQGAR